MRTLSRTLALDSKRVQFTPDLMPSDITGSLVFDSRSSGFDFRAGPVFTNVLLADEINRTPPKTQAALLEAMEERQVTVEGEARPLPAPFMVVATQNPVEYEGTYPLPEAQLDRFLLKLNLPVPPREDEMRVLALHHGGFDPRDLGAAGVRAVAGAEGLAAARAAVAAVRVRAGHVRLHRRHRAGDPGGAFPVAGGLAARRDRAAGGRQGMGVAVRTRLLHAR